MSLSTTILIANCHIDAHIFAQKILGPYPSSLKFTAHSSISPKTSKRRFNSARVQSDLSRPTYTTRLSSCSLRGKTEQGKEIKRGSLFFVSPLFLHRALMNWSWSLLWILTLSPVLSLFSVCLLCSSVIGSACFLLSDRVALWKCFQSALAPQFLFLSATHQPDAQWFLSNDAMS